MTLYQYVYVMLTGDTVPVQLDARLGQSAGEAAVETGSLAQRSVASRLVLVAAEDGIVSTLEFYGTARRQQLAGSDEPSSGARLSVCVCVIL